MHNTSNEIICVLNDIYFFVSDKYKLFINFNTLELSDKTATI